MRVYFHKDPRKAEMEPFYLKRYKGNFGELYEIRKNQMPRGSAYRRLNALEWKANYKKLQQANVTAKLLLDEVRNAKTST